jgi:hypothetical protein
MLEIHDHVIWGMIQVIFIIIGVILFIKFVKWLFFPKKLSKKQLKKKKSNSFPGNKDVSKKDILPMNDYYKKNPDVYKTNVKLFNFLGNIRNPFKYIYRTANIIRKKDKWLISNKEKLVLILDTYRSKNPIKLFKYLVFLFLGLLIISPYFNFNKEIIIYSHTEIILETNENLYSLSKKLKIHEVPLMNIKEGGCNPYVSDWGLCEIFGYSMYGIHLYSLYYKIYLFSNYKDIQINPWIYNLEWKSNIDEIINQIKNQSRLK